MHFCIMGFYFRFKSNKKDDQNIYERIRLLHGRPQLNETMEFADNYSPLLGIIENLLVLSDTEEPINLFQELKDDCGIDISELNEPRFVLYKLHECGIRMSDPIYWNNRLLRRFYVNFMPRDYDDYTMQTV